MASKSDVRLYQGNRIRVKHNEHKSCRRLLKTVLQVETCFVTRRPAEWFRKSDGKAKFVLQTKIEDICHPLRWGRSNKQFINIAYLYQKRQKKVWYILQIPRLKTRCDNETNSSRFTFFNTPWNYAKKCRSKLMMITVVNFLRKNYAL